MDKKELLEKEAATIFTPSQPITNPKLFSGRQELLEQLKSFVGVSGRNFVLYGKRGVGKTSFYNVLFQNSKAQMHTCSKRDDFVTVFLNVLSRLGAQFTSKEQKALAEAGYSFGADKVWSISSKLGAENVYEPIAEQKLNLGFLINKFKKLQKDIDVIILDEFQNINSPEIQTDIIEVIKGISDNKIRTQIAIVGVADSDEELLTSPEYSQYKMRHFIAAEIPEMNLNELKDILNKRQNLFNLHFGEEEKDWIARISSGSPTVTHSLALMSTYRWINRSILKFLAFPILGYILSGVEGALSASALYIKTVDVNIERRDLVSGTANWIKMFHSNYKLVSKSYIGVLKSKDAEGISKFLIMLAEGGFLPADKVAKNLQMKNYVDNDLKFFIKLVDNNKYIFANKSLLPYLRAWEYLKANDNKTYISTLNSLDD